MIPDNSVLLESLRGNGGFGSPVFFARPYAVVRADTLDSVAAAFAEAERYHAEGYYLAGYVAYEAGYAFEERLLHLPVGNEPLVWFGVYHAPVSFPLFDDELAVPCFPSDLALMISPSQWTYRLAIARVLDFISRGDVYQINYTGLLSFPFDGEPFRLYQHLRQSQKTDYAAYIHHDARSILCLSPELFFQVTDGKITTRPMKGTIRRGKTAAEDRLLAEELRSCPKNRAENTMIVDLLRNDLGRVCITGSISVESLFDVERYETLHQMTSTVSGDLRPGMGLFELFRNLFPCGSVTGAPKMRSMEIINELEYAPRSVYTGAIGYIAPNGDMLFNVAIRTVVVENGVAVLGVGSGIVADSEPEEEYQECLLKAAFLTEESRLNGFRLIETMRFECGIPLLDLHLERLKDSADYFGFVCDTDAIRNDLAAYASLLDHASIQRIRLLLSFDGSCSIESAVIEAPEVPVCIAIADKRVSSNNPFQYHKTTNRTFYTRELNVAHERGLFDMLFLNERDEVTEGCITNIFIERDGRLITPPGASGLLGGVYRRHVLETIPNAYEAVLTADDVRTAERIFVCNAVRGMMTAVLMDS